MHQPEFGNVWTEEKLNAIESYLQFYTSALKDTGFKLCYIDAFAGSGSIKTKSGNKLDGSAVRALKYPFDKFLFFEENQQVIEDLQEKIDMMPIKKNVEFFNTDCNSYLLEIDQSNWKKDNWRGVIFLDPFAMDLAWDCLNKISNTEIFDVWYLFPFMAANRNLYKNGIIPLANKTRLNLLLGSTDWENKIYYQSPQSSFWNEIILEKVDTENIKDYILSRLKDTFAAVSDKAVLLRNTRQSPVFMLCFAVSNPNQKAKVLSLKVADYILSQI